MSFPNNQNHFTHIKYRPDIDGLRAFAVLSVIAFHAFPNNIAGGFVGVDIFFVISGYLISSIILSSLQKENFRFLEFYARRIRRIFPALILVLATCFTAGWFFLLPVEFSQLGKHMAGSAVFIPNFIFWNESGYFDTAADTKLLLHLWSLGVEEQFYLVWPLLLWLAFRFRFNPLSLIVMIAILSFLLNIGLRHTDHIQIFYSPLTRFWELLIGGILAYLQLHRQQYVTQIIEWMDVKLTHIIFKISSSKQEGKALGNTISFIGIALLVWSITKIDEHLPYPGYYAVFPAMGAFLIIAAGKNAFLNRLIFSNKFAVWIGLISYPLYLWHWPLLAFAKTMLPDGIPTSYILLIIALSILLSWLTYIFIEIPIRNAKRNAIKTISLLVLMTLILTAGLMVKSLDGVKSRFSSEIDFFTTEPEIQNWDKGIRNPECVRTDDANFPPICIEENKPKILIFGDSHAASLYPGIKYLQKETKNKFGIVQFTQSGCPPFFVENINPFRPKCKKNNEVILDKIAELQPSVIIIAGFYGFEGYNIERTKIDQYMKELVNRLREKSEKSKIILIGPVPNWKKNLTNFVFNSWKNNYRIIPDQYSSVGEGETYYDIDAKLKTLSKEMKFDYISTYDLFCKSSQECMLWTEIQNEKELPTFDGQHLSKFGAIYVAKELIPIIQSLKYENNKSIHSLY